LFFFGSRSASDQDAITSIDSIHPTNLFDHHYSSEENEDDDLPSSSKNYSVTGTHEDSDMVKEYLLDLFFKIRIYYVLFIVFLVIALYKNR
jgi:hypothetical protein